MSMSPVQKSVIYDLAEGMITGAISTTDRDRLEQLLLGNIIHQQYYIEYFDLHADLIASAIEEDEQALAEKVLVSPKVPSEILARKLLVSAVASVSTLAFCLVIGVTLFLMKPDPPAAGTLVSLTANAKWRGTSYSPGDQVLERMTVSLEEGAASFELRDGAVISIEGPATLEMTDHQQTKLISGLLHAFVPREAIGYAVSTVDVRVVDLGTEFTVERSDDFGTRVVVKSGRVKATAVAGAQGSPSVFDLTAGRAMEFQLERGAAQELADSPEWQKSFDDFERSLGGVRRLDGIIRTTASRPTDLSPGKTPTSNFILLVRECSGLMLPEDVVIEQADGPVTIEAGTVVDTYLIHFDPDSSSIVPPIGSVTFRQPVYAVAGQSSDLNATDALCENAGVLFTHEDYRGLEQNHDRVELSADRKTLSFHFLRTAPVAMDQCRVFVRHAENQPATVVVQ
ncbi:FecR domain-containing protein [Calycomorphotria hydatis]|uniref:FecR protein n=1 Tax=Calycomorphotria hydatis TaxID=2528027 RepID=A0A517TDR7_9PLAN|nr:FecR domain-containing protein [Calycomorphotria hydatis]QDT66520.1 FecR protein [Calycomorphotria hydatis]